MLEISGNNVYNLRTDSRKNCVHSSTLRDQVRSNTPLPSAQVPSFPLVVRVYHLFVSTAIFAIFYLLNKRYTHNPHPLLLTPPNKI